MGHCIRVHLIKKSELRNEKIEYLVDNKDPFEIKWIELKEGILATTDEIPYFFMKDKMIAYITTDYFGGFGDQSAILYVNGKEVINTEVDNSVNIVLKEMGVISKDGCDEWDTIGLSNYRSNEDFKLF